MKHYTVMKSESIDNLNIKENGIYVDATLGYAGDSKEILKRLNKGFLYSFDKDEDAINYSTKELKNISNNFEIIHSGFKNLKEELEKRGITKIDGILYDLGLSSPEIDEERGFSFMRDETLDMRMDRSNPKDAKKVVNTYKEEDLRSILFKYGEEKLSGRIAKEIVNYRKSKEITTTLELVEIIKKATGANYFYKQHPERQVFQAIRIEVNNELEEIETSVKDAINMLNKGGRIVVISFHSLEDKIIKKIFRKYSTIDPLVKGLPIIPDEYKPLLKEVTHKPLYPKDTELIENSRSKSAKMRIAERI